MISGIDLAKYQGNIFGNFGYLLKTLVKPVKSQAARGNRPIQEPSKSQLTVCQ